MNVLSPNVPAAHEVTGLLAAWREGDRAALDQLMPLVEAELKRLARLHLRKERAGHTLQPTALINEAYLRLLKIHDVDWQDRAHFFAIASNMMRRVLVDHARRRGMHKRGGGELLVTLSEAEVVAQEWNFDLLALDEALTRLAAFDARACCVVELRYFGGLSVEETAQALGVSPRTVKGDWQAAKTLLWRALRGTEGGADGHGTLGAD
jgi:RNA polymerase sigma-70 factor, ECF subfamily